MTYLPLVDRAPDPQEGSLLWEPDPEAFQSARMADYFRWLAHEQGIPGSTYQEVWEWSTTQISPFWESIWEYFRVVGERGAGPALRDRTMPGTCWFEGATLNYAENCLRGVAGKPTALLAYSEVRAPVQLSGEELRLQVGSLAAHLRRLGVGEGDRVAAYLPSIPEAVVACLAAVSLGAIWSSCSPDFGEKAVLDRFQQIQPKVLLVADGYRYGLRDFDRRELAERLRRQLPSLEEVISVPYLFPEANPLPGGRTWEEVTGDPQEPDFVRVAFDHPLWILYSSGTTGLPKSIVHSHGGIVLEHLKVLGLHADLGPGDRSFWFTTTGWMMWNYLISALLLGACPVLFDGSPATPDLNRLWALASDARVSHFGSSAAHLTSCMKADLRPGDDLDLSELRFLGSTGSPLSPVAFEWIYRSVKRDVWVASLSGGTDLCTAFVLGSPGLPVRAGVIQCRGLGARVEAFDEAGESLVDQVGELVIREPMPSMPVFFWGDPDGSRYRESYFSVFPGVWRHGDWIRVRSDGGVIIYGRSDATINRHGVRMGTSEIYQVVEDLAPIQDSLVVDVAQSQGDSYLALFVTLNPGQSLTDQLVGEVKSALRSQLSPRHVPDLVQQVGSIPRTLSGKKLELPIKKILEGVAAEKALDLASLSDPASLTPFRELALEFSRQAAARPSG